MRRQKAIPASNLLFGDFPCLGRPMHLMRAFSAALLSLGCLGGMAHAAIPNDQRPRIVVSTDVPPLDVIPGGLGYGPPEKRSDPDDLQSLVRFLVYSDDFQVEGLVASSGTLANVANKQNLLDMIDVYSKVQKQLRANDANYPTADALRQRCFQGLSGAWGKPASEILGEGKDTEASRSIIRIIDESPQATWFVFWGGTRELAQALWRVRKERTPAQLAEFVSKIRVYMIAHQDGTGEWMEQNFPHLFIITSLHSYLGMAYGGDASLSDGKWVETHIRNVGPLGAAYPPAPWSGTPGMQEGDSPSLLYLISGLKGLGSVDDPTQGGWGGRFVPVSPGSRHYIDAPEGGEAISRWRPAFQNDFVARLQRSVSGPEGVNHAPRVVVDGDQTLSVLDEEIRPGGQLSLSASGSSDPDGDNLTYHWWIYPEAGDAGAQLQLIGNDTENLDIRAPASAKTQSVDVILEVKDSGTPQLTSYRRVIIHVGAPQMDRK